MKPAIGTYRYGSAREPGEGLRIGAARLVPRGVRRKDWQQRGFFDLRMPILAPSLELLREFRGGKLTFTQFARRYRAEMKKSEPAQVIGLLAGMSLFMPISIGCFCEEEARCHRSLLQPLILTAAREKSPGFATLWRARGGRGVLRFASPVCLADWEEEP